MAPFDGLIDRIRSLIAPLVFRNDSAALLVEIRGIRFDGTARRALVFHLVFVDIGLMLLKDVIGRLLHPDVDFRSRIVMSRLLCLARHELSVPPQPRAMRTIGTAWDGAPPYGAGEFLGSRWVLTSGSDQRRLR